MTGSGPARPRPRSMWIRIGAPLLLLSVSTLLALLLAEAGLRLLRPQVFPTIPGGLFTDRADGLRVLTPGFEGVISRAEFHAPVRIGSFGVRGEGPRPRTERTFRILALGDSQTFGFGVLDPETYSVQLETILSERHPDLDVQVVNAGVPGYGTIDELIWLRERGREADPDLIVAQFLSVNDFAINRSSPLADRVLGRGDGSEPAPAPAQGTEPGDGTGPAGLASWFFGSLREVKRRSHLITLVSETASYVGMRMGLLGGVAAMWGEDFTPADADRTRHLLVLLAQEARRMDVPIILMYTTGKAHVIAGDGEPLPSAVLFESAAREAEVPWIDMRQELRTRDDRLELYYVRDGHWTAAGHRAVAEVLAERLAELGALPR